MKRFLTLERENGKHQLFYLGNKMVFGDSCSHQASKQLQKELTPGIKAVTLSWHTQLGGFLW